MHSWNPNPFEVGILREQNASPFSFYNFSWTEYIFGVMQIDFFHQHFGQHFWIASSRQLGALCSPFLTSSSPTEYSESPDDMTFRTLASVYASNHPRWGIAMMVECFNCKVTLQKIIQNLLRKFEYIIFQQKIWNSSKYGIVQGFEFPRCFCELIYWRKTANTSNMKTS